MQTPIWHLIEDEKIEEALRKLAPPGWKPPEDIFPKLKGKLESVEEISELMSKAPQNIRRGEKW